MSPLGRLRPLYLGAILTLVIGFAIVVSLSEGSHSTEMAKALNYLWQDDGSNAAFAVRELRLPRVLCAAGVGAALAISGALIQVVIRNPLGDPGLTGVTGGAAFGVALGLTAITASPSFLLLAGVCGGLVAAAMTFTIARNNIGLEPMRIILAGIAVAIFFLAATSAVMVINRSSMQTLYLWMVGGFINRGWVEFHLLWPVLCMAAAVVLALVPVLKVLQFDDAMAGGMGVSAGRWRIVAGVVSVVLASVSVAVAGPLAFVGFVAPHLARLSLGPNTVSMRRWLIITALIGAALVSWSDTAARLLFDGRAPAGVLITILGAAAFLTLARREAIYEQ